MNPFTQKRTDGFFLALFLIVFAFALAGCASLRDAPFETKALAAATTIDELQKGTKTALDAKVITSADAENIIKAADAGVAGIAVARQYNRIDPVAGTAKLQAVMAGLAIWQSYLVAKGVK